MIASIIGMAAIVAVFIIFYFKYKEANDTTQGVVKNDFASLSSSLIPLLLLFFIVSGVYLISKASVDSTTICSPVINESVVVGNTTTNTYTEYCVVGNNNAPGTMFKGLNILVYIIYTVIFTGFVLNVLTFFGVIYKR